MKIIKNDTLNALHPDQSSNESPDNIPVLPGYIIEYKGSKDYCIVPSNESIEERCANLQAMGQGYQVKQLSNFDLEGRRLSVPREIIVKEWDPPRR